MDHWFSEVESRSKLSADAVQALHDVGFIVIPGPVPAGRLAQFAEAYDSAVAGAAAEEVSVGRTTTRVHDFVNRGPEFDGLYIYEPILEACCRIIDQPFKLSTMLARTVRPYSPAQSLHVDFRRDLDGWPMLGFILMVDEFHADNGATRFVPGSHEWSTLPADISVDYEGQVLACGVAGSVIVYNGSVWHGHAANRTGEPRRSIQGAYIRRDAEPAIKQAVSMSSDPVGRTGELAKYVLAV